MPAEVTKKWSVLSYNGEEAEEVYQVIGVSNAIQAQIAPGIPQLNTGYPGKPQLKSLLPVVSSGGYGLYEVTVRYAIPPAGNWQEQEINPVDRATRIRWEIGNSSEPIDLALDASNQWAVPILNSAGDPYDPPIHEDFGTLFLHVYKFVTDFDLIMAMNYRNAVNTDAFTVLGRYSVSPGQSRCVLMGIPADYNINATWVEAQLTLEFRADGFDRRLLDKGYRGWQEVSGTTSSAPFTDVSGNNVTAPILLDGTGKPLDSTIKVNGQTPVEAPDGFGLPSGVEVEQQTSARFLKYQTKKKLAFAPLLQFFNS